jgi:ATP-binding cassette subfamily F protein 3
MLVSHDRALLRETCDEFWLVTRGGVQPFDGDLDDYQKWLLDVSRAAAKGQPAPDVPRAQAPAAPPAPAAATAIAASPPAPRRDDRKHAAQSRSQLANRTRPMRQEAQQIDARMAKLAAEKADLEALLAAGKRPGAEIADTGRRLNHIAAEVTMLEERWLALQTEIETITAAG